MAELLYGRHPVRESLLAGRRAFHRLLLVQGVEEQGIVSEIEDLARRAGVTLQRVPRGELDHLGNHQGLAAEVSPYPYADWRDMLEAAEERDELPLLLLLDLLQDPQNVGTLLRTAEAVGVHGVILQERRQVGITPAVVSSSAGGVEHLLVARVTNLVRTMKALKEAGLWLVGLEDLPEARPYDEVDLDMPLGLVVGSEGRGMRRLVRETCDFLLRLPMRGRINSLNASVAGSIALYAAWRQRLSPA
ncbi:MAG: 23S rRNA (guanosine(2251)-2'-O)-methyltransferase RlmB [Chloroflexota bacterium]|nr:23S rRNA (guanosine(2251)-2'-O)-methyltransferase RlmB [Chloroflexota bacterium]